MKRPSPEESAGARYTHGHDVSVLSAHHWRTAANSAAYLLPHLRPGMSLLDVGCGPGSITLDLADAVAPALVIGIDVAPIAIAAAGTGAAARGVTNVRFVEGDVHRLPVEPRSMDVVHAHQVLQHLADPVDALRAMASVTKRGGFVATRDADYGAMTWHPAAAQLDRWRDLYRSVALANGGQPDAARWYGAWARRAELFDVTFTASTWLFATPADRTWWGTQWAKRSVESAFGRHAVGLGLATAADLHDIADGWRRWATHPDAWFLVVHGEMLARVGP